MGKFKTICGKEFEVKNNNTHASGIFIAREYPEDKKEYSFELCEQCKNCVAQKIEFAGEYCSMSDMKDCYHVKNTICIADNIENKEYTPVVNYSEPCLNTVEEYCFEITLQTDSLIRYLYHNIPASRYMSAYDHIEDLIENVWEELFDEQVEEEDCTYLQMFDSQRGETVDIELYDIDDLKKLVTGIRMVEFSQKISGKDN